MRRRGLIDPRQERLAEQGRRTLGEVLAAFEAKLRAANRHPRHVAATINHIQSIADSAGFNTVADITADGVNAYAVELDEKREDSLPGRLHHVQGEPASSGETRPT